MNFNWLIISSCTLIPLLVGFIWYHPKTFGSAWQKEAEVTDEKMKGANMGKIFGLTLLLGFMIALTMSSMVIHQMHVFSIFANDPAMKDPNSEIGKFLTDFMAKYGNNFRTFKHGAFHGTLVALFFALPLMAINALFERKSFKYIAINTGYWMVTLALMGGVICAFA